MSSMLFSDKCYYCSTPTPAGGYFCEVCAEELQPAQVVPRACTNHKNRFMRKIEAKGVKGRSGISIYCDDCARRVRPNGTLSDRGLLATRGSESADPYMPDHTALYPAPAVHPAYARLGQKYPGCDAMQLFAHHLLDQVDSEDRGFYLPDGRVAVTWKPEDDEVFLQHPGRRPEIGKELILCRRERRIVS